MARPWQLRRARDADAGRSEAGYESLSVIRHLLARKELHATSNGCPWPRTGVPRVGHAVLPLRLVAPTSRGREGQPRGAGHMWRFIGDGRHPRWPRREPEITASTSNATALLIPTEPRCVHVSATGRRLTSVAGDRWRGMAWLRHGQTASASHFNDASGPEQCSRSVCAASHSIAGGCALTGF